MDTAVKTGTTYKMYIDGQFVESHSGKSFPVYDPSTEEVIAECPAGDAQDLLVANPNVLKVASVQDL